ncbi:hypothetical protein [Bradyrhizobium tropiciagri]|uniref:hypothetical protein n=1 Tax=Bradyrhizobium tropiciagri TaxID=312253 RepID=UPI000AB13E2C
MVAANAPVGVLYQVPKTGKLRSSVQKALPSALMRTTNGIPVATRLVQCDQIASLAASLSTKGTASSRSRITASAPLATAFWNRSGRLAGTMGVAHCWIGTMPCNWNHRKAMAHYLHHDDEAKQDAQIKRIKRRKQAARK